MGTSSSFAEAAEKLSRVGGAIDRLSRSAANAIGMEGKKALLDHAAKVFGPDRALSGARRGSLRRPTTARYIVRGDRVEIFPVGPPFYLFARGRQGGKPILPRKRGRALRMPDGEFRSASVTGEQKPRPDIIDPVVEHMEREAPKIIHQAAVDEIVKVLG